MSTPGSVASRRSLLLSCLARAAATSFLLLAIAICAAGASRATSEAVALGVATGTTSSTIAVLPAEDTYMDAAHPDDNTGTEVLLRVGGNEPNRALVRFEQADITSIIGAGSFLSAKLQLFATSSKRWNDESRPVRVHRLTRSWSEGGATWNCPVDSNPANDAPNCVELWSGARGSFAKVATAELTHGDATSGYVSYDVTDDVGGALVGTASNFGWLVKKQDEDQDGGEVEYASGEAAAGQRPRLVVEFSNVAPTPTPNPACAATPISGCRQSLEGGRTQLLLKKSASGRTDKLAWKWMKGETTALGDFGDPTRLFNGTKYSICLYDEVAGRASLVWGGIVPAALECGGNPCWKATGASGFRYSDRERSTAGVQGITLRAGGAGNSKIVVNGKGEGLRLPALPLRQDQRVVAQLKSDAGQCWEARFSAPAKRNKSSFFKDVNDAPGTLAPTRTSTATRTRTPVSGTTPPPIVTATPSRTATSAGAPTSPPTVAPTPTFTVPVPTVTPVRTNTPSGPRLGGGQCTLAAGSVIRLFTGFLARDLPANGAISVDCGTLDAQGRAACSCGVVEFDPVSVPGIGFACIKPASAACAPGSVACNGGSNLGQQVTGDHDRTLACSSNADCASKCASKCGSPGRVLLSGCEGFCSLGSQQACTLDANCLPNNGACNGKNGVPLGNVCECTCVDGAVGPPAGAGGLQCQLAFNLVIEAATPNPPNCDGFGDNPLINVGDTCAPLTTQNVTALLNNAEGSAGVTIPSTGAYADGGAAISCNALGGGNLNGLELRGATIFYGSTIGDLVTALIIDCQ